MSTSIDIDTFWSDFKNKTPAEISKQIDTLCAFLEEHPDQVARIDPFNKVI